MRNVKPHPRLPGGSGRQTNSAANRNAGKRNWLAGRLRKPAGRRNRHVRQSSGRRSEKKKLPLRLPDGNGKRKKKQKSEAERAKKKLPEPQKRQGAEKRLMRRMLSEMQKHVKSRNSKRDPTTGGGKAELR